MRNTFIILLSALTFLAATMALTPSVAADDTAGPLSLIVTDPLAAPLSCPCVEGYAQRKYEVLASHLEDAMGRKVKVTFGESFAAAVKKAGGKADIIIGKDSVVRADTNAANFGVQPLGHLTDKQGATTQYGMIVVNRDDPAKKVEDLDGYTVIFGPSEADEKHAAAFQLLKAAKITVPKKLTIDMACSEGACKVIDLGPKSKTAAVISSYAQPLLEGCGTIKKGDLRVVGKTEPVPFITVFVSKKLNAGTRERLRFALQSVALETNVLEAMESLVGFLPYEKTTLKATPTVAKKKQ